jgi:Putative Actinobacterial Holin-X, holin superfamily III
MADRIPADTSPSVASLLGGIASDLQTLVRQEVSLAKAEILREWDKAKAAAGAMAVGAAVLALGGLFLCLTIVALLHEVAGLPWWASFLIVGGVFSVLGLVLFFTGRNKAAQVNVVPPQTAETMRENVQWIRNQT